MNISTTIFPRLKQALVAGWLLGLACTTHAGTLADAPLNLKSGVPPNVMFALSVEYPTANTAAYQDTGSYAAGNTYLGYFDPDKCYFYDTSNNWFYPSHYGDGDHGCQSGGGGWIGNILNWATMTGLDEFRYAMTGGNRYRDTASLTVLERTYQSGQGGTSNFPNKTYTDPDSDATTYPGGTTITFANQGLGSRVQITPSTAPPAETVTCNTFNYAGPSCASLTTASGAYTCTAWTGTGLTSASPYRCTAMTPVGPELTPTSITAVSPAASGSSGATATSVACSNPTLTGSTFDCDLTMATGSTGSCSSWAGTGAAATPYTCSSFSSFSGGEVLTTTGLGATASFTASETGSNVVDPSSSTWITCTVTAGTPVVTSCTLTGVGPLSGQNATCNTYSGSGNSTTPYACNGFSIPGGGTYVTSSPKTGSSTTTTVSTKVYRYKYRVTYTPPATTTTKYYTPSYTGTYGGTAYYYTSSYTLGFGGAVIYYVRVKVCDDSVGQESNCKQYGSSWKPTGVVQDNGDKMRFGVTSYFQANDIDNAVLRSKAKYVAPYKWSPAGGLISNSQTEWSSTDGTLFSNPDSGDAATATSFIGSVSNTGVINYINKFGNTALTYKTYDVLGKLYYETMRYLRSKTAAGAALGPTLDFYRGAKSTNADGFPVITTWDDPVLYSCQKNYIITMGDTHTWCDKRLPGGSHTTVGSTTCNAYTDGNTNAHVQDTGSLSGDSDINVTTSTNEVGTLEGLANRATTLTGAGSSASYYMAGLAKWAASNDIRRDLAGTQTIKTFVIDVEEYKDCGYQSQFWLAAKYGDPAAYTTPLSASPWTAGTWQPSTALDTSVTPNKPFNPWYDTTKNQLTLPASACTSRAPTGYNAAGGAVTWPPNLLRAGDPLAMINSVKSAIAQISSEIGSEAALAQSSGSLDTGTGAYIYRAKYNSDRWQGDVEALPISQTGVVSSSAAWSAKNMLPVHGSRTIYTFNDGYTFSATTDTSASPRVGVAFTAANFGSLSAGQQSILDADEFGTDDSLGSDRINYLRGDQSKEAFLPGTNTVNPSANHGWRSRLSILGDVLNSSPFFVGEPSGTGPAYAKATYKTFAAGYASRAPRLYFGGNDGMLHALDATYTINSTTGMPEATITSGTETFAYVPSAVFGNLSKLMASGYEHKYFVDAPPLVADACFGSCAASTDWKSVLVGSLNAGGQGIFALDVTNPATAFSATNVLWEFTDKDDADLGYTFSKPIIRQLNNGKWAVIFGNGFNNTNADSSSSSTGRAYLYILYVDGPGAGQYWTLGTNYFKIALKSPDEGASPTLPLSPPNGLSTVVSQDVDFNGAIDDIFAGDRKGNIWKIDLAVTRLTVDDSTGFGVGETIRDSGSGTGTILSVAGNELVVTRYIGSGFTATQKTVTNQAETHTTNLVSAIGDPSLYQSPYKFVSGDPKPLFSASDGATTPTRQQITTGIAVAPHPDGGTMVMFGTGAWIDISDKYSPFGTESLYGIWDNGSSVPAHATYTTVSDRGKLQKQKVLVYADTSGNTANASSVPYTALSLDASGNPVYAIYSSCIPNYSTTAAATSNASDTCPSTIAYAAGTIQQRGWVFDLLAGSGERVISSVPILDNQNASTRFATLIPTNDPCAGHAAGNEYNLNTQTGGEPPVPIYVAGDDNSGKVVVSRASLGLSGGGNITVKLGGKGSSTGATDNAITFNIGGTAATATTTTGNPMAPCAAGSCEAGNPTFIPGWGMNLTGGTNAGQRLVLRCNLDTGGAITCGLGYKSGNFGRITWKQINR